MIDTDEKIKSLNLMLIAFMALELLDFKYLPIFVFQVQNPPFWIYAL